MKNPFYFLITLILVVTACKKEDNSTLDNLVQTPSVKLESTYNVNLSEDVIYAEGLSHISLNSTESSAMPLLLDAYVPNNDAENRPVLMLVHGGGFTGGSKQQEPLVDLANYFAERGFVVFSIDYRLQGDIGTVAQDWVDFSTNIPTDKINQYYAMYPAHRDAKAALRWIVANASTYNINTDYITVGGGSAGATTSIGISVSKLDDFKDEISTEEDNSLLTTNFSQSYKVQTILDFWGSRNSIEILEGIDGVQRFSSASPSLFIAHGTEDSTVLYTEAEALREICQTNQIPYVFYELTGKGHGAWSATVDELPLAKLAYDFVVEQQDLILE
ncbi:MAG: alpha/beta hydrolase [Saprospiraceae bacterium]|nr:alpha/beta hydrolase [Saprospiraceae bacterium]